MKKRTIGWMAAIMIALLLSAVGLPHVPPVRRFALARLSAYLRQSQGIVLEARSLDYNLLSLRFWLEGLSLRDDKATGFPPFLTAERIQLHLSFSALVHGALAAQRLEVDGLRLQLATRQDGSSNLPRNLGKTTGESELRLPAESLDVSNLSVSLDDERSGLSLQFPAAGVSGRTDRPDSQELRGALQQAGTIVWGGRKLPIEQLGLNIRLQSESVTLQSLELESAGSWIQASGTLQDFKSPRFRVATQAKIQSKPLAAWLGIKEPVEGGLDADLQIAGNVEHPVIEGEIRSPQLTIAGVRTDSLAAAGRFDFSTGILELRNLSSELYSGQVRATGQLALGGKGRSNIICQAKELNLRQISRGQRWRTLPPAARSCRPVPHSRWVPGMAQGRSPRSKDFLEFRFEGKKSISQ